MHRQCTKQVLSAARSMQSLVLIPMLDFVGNAGCCFLPPYSINICDELTRVLHDEACINELAGPVIRPKADFEWVYTSCTTWWRGTELATK